MVGADTTEHLSGIGTTQQQQQQWQERAVDVGDVNISELADGNVLMRHGTTATDKMSKRLIAVVSDDTIHFIGAKEKLRKQLNYSGHFYRFVELLALCGAGVPSPFPPFPLVHLLPHLLFFFFFPFFHWLYLFSSFVHSFPFYQNSPTPFPGRRS